MRNRYLVLGLSAFLALALAVPAIGGPSNPIADGAASAKKTAQKALKKAKKANKAAKAAQSSADAAQLSADGAQSTADGAQSAAEAAQTSADAAQASADAAQSTADSKYGSVTNVEGTTSPTNNANKSTVFASCPSGRDLSGGGFIVNGAGNEDATVVLNSAYLDAWGVTADDQGTNGGTWDVTPTARCIGP